MRLTHAISYWPVAAGVVVVMMGCRTEQPVAEDIAQRLAACGALAEDPPEVPSDVTIPPTILNSEQSLETLRRLYPEDLRYVGSKVARLHMLIDTTGAVVKAQVARSTGYPRLDTAAIRATASFRFTPPYEGRRPACHWVTLPVPLEP